PWLIPDTHKSGFLPLKILFTASLTQSTGVPEHLYISTPSYNSILSKRSGLPMVIACPIPDCGLSGATTTTSPSCCISSSNTLIPGAVIPSSLTTKIVGFFFTQKRTKNRPTEIHEPKYTL